MKMSNEFIGTIIVACLGSVGLWTFINNVYLENKKEDKSIALLKKAELVLLQDRLLHLCTKYLEEYSESSIDANKMNSLHNLYEVYVELGGNSFIEDLMKKCNQLKVK